jgi:phospho-N-acetylmuramoyl-pentapeptide-transferase
MFADLFPAITVRTIYSLVTAFLMCLVLGPMLISRMKIRQYGQTIRQEGPESHFSKQGVPTMGGLILIISILVTALLWSRDVIQIWVVAAAVIWLGILGFVDDFLIILKKNTKGVSGVQKIIWQTAFGLALGFFIYNGGMGQYYCYTLETPGSLQSSESAVSSQSEVLRQSSSENPLYSGPSSADPDILQETRKNKVTNSSINVPFAGVVDLGWLFIPFAALIIVSASNAGNLTDGLDGLASGTFIIVAIVYAAISYIAGNINFAGHLDLLYIPGSGELTVFCAAIIGACMGFLWYNSFPAQIFMGDTGSLALGGLAGTIAILTKSELLLCVVGGIFVIEALSVIIQVVSFKLRGKRVFKMAPIHHHFELMGWPESKVVLRFWIIAFILAILGVSIIGLSSIQSKKSESFRNSDNSQRLKTEFWNIKIKDSK